jgi:hypothetical protein
MADKDIPDYMRGFDLDNDWGFTPVSSKPKDEQPGIDPKLVEGTNIELSKVKSDVSTIKSMMNEIMQIVNDNKNLKILKRLYYRFYIIYQKVMNLIYIGRIEVQL